VVPSGHGQPYVLAARGPNGPEQVHYVRRRRWSEILFLARRRMSEQQPCQSPQPPQPPESPQPPQLGWPAPPANPYGYPPPPTPYAAVPPNPYAAPPNPYAVPTYGYPSPSPYSYAPPPRTHHGRNLLIGGIVVALVVAVVAVAAQHPRSSSAASAAGGVTVVQAPASPSAPAQSNQAPQPSPSSDGSGATQTSPLSSSSGSVVFADDFSDPDTGWGTGSDDDSTYTYRPDGYYMTSYVAAHFLSYSPYDTPQQQMEQSVTATEVGGAEPGAGFGVICRRGPDSATQLRYEFAVTNSGKWYIERNQGALSISVAPTILSQGVTQVVPGASALTLTSVCATLADGTTTRLTLFLNGVKVADTVDVATLDAEGWLGGVLTTNASSDPATTIFNYYNETDLGNAGILAANT
jgi:hypothetical protein